MAAAAAAAAVVLREDAGANARACANAGAGAGANAGAGAGAGAGAATDAMWPEALRRLVREVPSLGGVLRAVPMETAAEQSEQKGVQIGQAEQVAPLLLPLSEVVLAHI